MKIEKINNEYILPITYKCNWNCDYCIVDTHNQKDITITELLDAIKSIPDNSVVHLEGGEPGTLDKLLLIQIISKLKDKRCSIFLNTNGLFLKRYPDLLIHIDDILYHCIEKIEDHKDIIFYDTNVNITYMLIVNDNNISDLEYYLTKYKDIEFFISSDLTKKFTKKNALYILKKYNIHKDSLQYLIRG